MASLQSRIKGRQQRSVIRRFTGAGEFFYWLPHLRWLAVLWTSSRGDWGDDFDWIREQFLDLYYLYLWHTAVVCQEHCNLCMMVCGLSMTCVLCIGCSTGVELIPFGELCAKVF